MELLEFFMGFMRFLGVEFFLEACYNIRNILRLIIGLGSGEYYDGLFGETFCEGF